MGGSTRFYSVHLFVAATLQACSRLALITSSKRVVTAYAVLTLFGLEKSADLRPIFNGLCAGSAGL